jgi:hypothetical protein
MQKSIIRKRWQVACMALALMGGMTLAHAQVPAQIHYQGRLVVGDAPVSATIDLVFRIYDVVEGGQPLFVETQAVTVVDGFYSAYIGAAAALDGGIFHTTPMTYLEVEVDGQRLVPRDRLVTVAYAFKAQYAEEAAVAHRLVGDSKTAAVINPGPEPLHVNSTTNVAFHVHRDGLNQNIGTNGEKMVFWRAEEFDTASTFDLGNDRFVAPVTGFYRLTAQILLDPPGPPKSDPAYLGKLVLMHNSTNRLAVDVTRFRKGQSQSMNVTREVQLTSGDQVEVYVGHSHKGTSVLSGSSYHTYFSGFLLQQ